MAFEKKISANPVIPIGKRYFKSYKDNHDGYERILISVEEMARLITSDIDIGDKAIIAPLAKTRIRRNELISLDVSDVDFVEKKIRLKPTAKRTNRTVFLMMNDFYPSAMAPNEGRREPTQGNSTIPGT